jgi:sortase A
MTSRVTTGRAVLRSAGELLITAGIVLLLFVVYELYGTGLTTAREQARLERELAHAWETPPPAVDRPAQAVRPVQPPGLGEPVAVLTVPRLGEDYRHVVVEGVGREELKKGPGHQPGTATPGELGNVVVAGHRTTYGAPFGRFDEISAGDEVVLTDASGSYTYRISGTEVVEPSDVAVVLPVPRQPGAGPTQRLLTLITCTPKYSARFRLVIRGELVVPGRSTA